MSVASRVLARNRARGAGAVGRARRTARDAARSICLLGAASGIATFASTLVPGPADLDLTVIRLVAVATLGLSVLLVLLPWQRMPLPATLVFIPVGLSLIGVHNAFSAQDAYRYGVFFLVLFVWIGLWHPRGTASLSAPFAAVAYVLPLVVGSAPDHAVWTVVYALPVYVLVGEAIAWRSASLDAALTRLHHLARTDPLTDLVNRTVLEQALADEGSPYTHGALVYLDVDDFKWVNDTVGHAGGDEILRGVADALRASVREQDLPVRIAGDEFAVLLAGPVSRTEAVRVAARIRGHLGGMLVAGRPVRTSIGVAWCAGGTTEQLLHRADLAMYQAKTAGHGPSDGTETDSAGTSPGVAAGAGLVLADGAPDR